MIAHHRPSHHHWVGFGRIGKGCRVLVGARPQDKLTVGEPLGPDPAELKRQQIDAGENGGRPVSAINAVPDRPGLRQELLSRLLTTDLSSAREDLGAAAETMILSKAQSSTSAARRQLLPDG